MVTPLKHPYIPLTDPPAQLDAVFHFCTAWGGPIILDYDNRKMVLILYLLSGTPLLPRGGGGDPKADGRV